ncbi:calcineurin-like phosphoesterase C-terminal domain-containing protein [Flavobacterium algicola]|uniref:calcineurin-like phosphoesterase C-terminal domain-containing protein n=1 Tax=Flavobacterium algicola TaxID=556529 RepID=UPI001EFCE9D2|nr:calcineurin-like phosphoesterase family protein [Flavobacterium algicola]MCG9792395.1 calcineurin-like phosphoesterase family protein [Flavobacterium algicola]
MKKLFLFICTALFTLVAAAQNKVSGYVYNDGNLNSKKEAQELGIENVAVTNGKQVVLTDKNGKYELPIGNDNIISVIKPSGYAVATNANNLPQFFYNYKPNGSPDLKFKGVAPTGKLPKSVDFGLIQKNETEEFSTLIFGDPQPYTLEEIAYFKKGIVSEVKAIKNISFGLSLGDLVGNDLSLFTPYIEAVKAVEIPWYNVMGNHDMNFDAKTDNQSDETYEAHFGPANYAFNYGKVHFIVLDDILYPDPRDGEGYWGGLREDQLNFIANDLKFVPKDHLVVLAFHIPLSEPEDDSYRDEDRNALFNLLKDFPNTLSLSAHTHIQRQDFFEKKEGWLRDKPHHEYNVGTTSGDWYSGKLNENGIPISTMRDGTPKGYAFIHFNGNQYKIDYKVANKPKEFQIEIFAPKVVAKGRKTQAGIYANFFMGTPKDRVMCRIDEGKWNDMTYVSEYDPSYVTYVNEWDTTTELMPGRRSSNPIISKHLWQAPVPSKLEVGEHRIEIKATDMYGNEFIEKSSYRIENPK